MSAFELAAVLGDRLDEDGLAYAIGGALALTAWAIPRDTKDVDISIFVAPEEMDRVFDALDRAGVMIDRADAMRSIARIGMFSGRRGRTLVDVFVGDHPHFHAMRDRRTQLPLPSGRLYWFVSAEDLCVLKLLYGRTKDIADLERMFAALPDLDFTYVRDWVAVLPASEHKLELLADLERRFRSVRG
jgi:hypothetical protein